jgi:recombination protein RecA
MAKFREKLGDRYGGRLSTPKQSGYEIISTGSIGLDYATRVGGLVRGRTHELVGLPGVCKTTLGILAAAEHQKATGKAVGWIDMEQSFDWDWAESLGLDTSEKMLTHIYPDNSEDVADMNRLMATSELFSFICVDSIGGMESKKAFEKDAEEVTMGKNAQVITRMVKQAAALARQNGITILYINQLRANLSGMAKAGDIAAGPKALQYNTTMSIRLSRKSSLADAARTIGSGDTLEEVGRRYVARVTRSRVAAQGRVAEFWMNNQETGEFGPIGIDQVAEAVALGLRAQVFERKGNWITLPGREKPVNGEKAVVAALRKEPEIIAQIRDLALKKVTKEIDLQALEESGV